MLCGNFPNQVLVSVILPNYNHEVFLRQRIDSILGQTFQNFELIILDDFSSDNSRIIIESYRGNPKVTHILYNSSTSGSPFSQWIKGIEIAIGNFIWVAESDDYCEKKFLENMIGEMTSKNINFGFCRSYKKAGNELSINKWGEQIQPSIWNNSNIFEGRKFISSFLLYRNVIPNASAVIFKKELFKNCEKLKEMRFAGDWFLWIVLADQTDVYYCNKVMNYFRFHESSTRTLKRLRVEESRVEEYFMCIYKACKKTKTKFDANNIQYKWIIDEWIMKSRRFPLIKRLFPPFPFLFLLKFHKLFFGISKH